MKIIKSLFNKIKNFFVITPEKSVSKRTLKQLGYLDVVWVLDKDMSLIECWVFDINKKYIIVSTFADKSLVSKDYRFNINCSLTNTYIRQGGRILFVNKPCEKEILSFCPQIEGL